MLNPRRTLRRRTAQLHSTTGLLEETRCALQSIGYTIDAIEDIPRLVGELARGYVDLDRRLQGSPSPAMLSTTSEPVMLPPPVQDVDLSLPDFGALAPMTAPPPRFPGIATPLVKGGEASRPALPAKPAGISVDVVNDRLAARLQRAETEGVSYGVGSRLPGQNSAPKPAKLGADDQRQVLSAVLGRTVEPPQPGMPNRMKH